MQTSKLPVELLNDIKNFSKMKKQIIKKYDEYDIEVDKYGWLVNDIYGYYNDDLAFIDGVSDGNIEKVSRLFLVKDKSYLDKYHLCNVFHDIIQPHCEILHLKKLFNRSLGCLTPKERQEFLDSIYT